jgi:hypothetical protein
VDAQSVKPALGRAQFGSNSPVGGSRELVRKFRCAFARACKRQHHRFNAAVENSAMHIATGASRVTPHAA